jgi:PAS domain S-box-containing protein
MKPDEALISKNILLKLLSANNDLIFIKDEVYRYCLVNQAYQDFLKKSEAEILGKTDLELMPPTIAEACHLSDQEVFETGKTISRIERVENELWEVFKFPMILENQKTGIAGIIRNVTPQKQLEEDLKKREKTLQKIFDLLPIGLWIADEKGKLLRGNPAGVKIWGAEPKVGIENYGVFKARRLPEGQEISPQDWALAKTIQSKIAIQAEKIEIDAYDGVKRIVLNYTAPVLDDDETMLGAIVVNQDISEEEKIKQELITFNAALEDRVKERTQELEQSNRELDAFAYSISHDLRAPLRAINGFSEILQEDHEKHLNEDGKFLLTTIRANVGKMDSLISNLLHFSRVSRAEINKQKIDMTILVKAILEELIACKNKQVSYTIETLPVVEGDVSLIKQVWFNLLDNAIKYSSQQETSILHISSQANDQQVVFSIKDNGVGFDQTYAHKLFHVFQRLHSEKEFEGTGAGLAIVKRIIQRHHGQVWAEGSVQAGATFYFSLPLST